MRDDGRARTLQLRPRTNLVLFMPVLQHGSGYTATRKCWCLRPYTSPEAEAPTRRGRLACAPARERLTSDVRGIYSTSLTIAHTGGAAHSPHEDPPLLRPAHAKQAEPLWELEEAECGRGDRPVEHDARATWATYRINWDATCAATSGRRSSETRKPTSSCAKSIAQDTNYRRSNGMLSRREFLGSGGGRGAGHGARRQSGTFARVCVFRCPSHRRTA